MADSEEVQKPTTEAIDRHTQRRAWRGVASDEMLMHFVRGINMAEGEAEMSLTSSISGTVVSGILVPESRFSEEVRLTFAGAQDPDSIPDVIATMIALELPPHPDQEINHIRDEPKFLHLRDAAVVGDGVQVGPRGPWRVRLGSVDAWQFGSWLSH